MLIDAIKNPLIYLNFAIYCWRTNRLELAQSNLRNFHQLSDNVGVRFEVRDDYKLAISVDILPDINLMYFIAVQSNGIGATGSTSVSW